jgi:hypothetical protein
MGSNAASIKHCRERIADTARAMLEGQISYIEGSRLILTVASGADVDRYEDPFVAFIGIDSETDDVPVGQLREMWYPPAKLQLESKWAEAENYAKQIGEAACREVLVWLDSNPVNAG